MSTSKIDFLSSLDGAFMKGDYVYFFKGDEYLEYNWEHDEMSLGYPRKISDGFEGVYSENIDATFTRENYTYFFKGDEYTRFNWNKNKVSEGYPRKISSEFNGVYSENIDAIINKNDEEVYFFQGGNYVKYHWKGNESSENRSIQEYWDGLDFDRIDAAFCVESGMIFKKKKYYFFRNEKYSKFDVDDNKVPDGYPDVIGQYWNLISGSNWMSKINDATYLSQMSIPGTHDSGANRIIPYAQCQKLSVSNQLYGGIRCIDMRCRVNSDGFAIYHDKVPQFKAFGSILDGICKFLENNPSEGLIMNLQNTSGYGENFRTIFDKYYRNYKGITWYGLHDQVDAKDFKSLQLKDIRGKVLVIDNGPKPNVKGSLQGKYRRYDVFVRGKNLTPLDDDGKNVDEKWKFVESDLKTAKTNNGKEGLYMNTCAGVNDKNFPYWSPSEYAQGTDTVEGINSRIASYLKQNPIGAYGVMSMDFAFSTDGLVSKLIYANKPHFK